MKRLSPRRGFTLIELIVVIAIIAVLIGLLTSAVQNVRAASARVQCANKLRQVGLALHNYHGTYNAFPPGMSSPNGDGSLPYLSWHARILPFIEQSALWEQATREYAADPAFFVKPHAPLSVIVPAFVCPADAQAQRLGNYHGLAVAFTSYLGVEGVDLFRRDGILFVDSHVRFADVIDGTSNTLLVGERPPSADALFGWWYAGSGQMGEGSADMVLGAREQNYSVQRFECPNGPYDYGPDRISNPCSVFHFWSFHSNGAHFLFADGSVRFLSYSAAPLLPALATRAGGEDALFPD